MALGEDEIRFRERMAEFIGSVNATLININNAINKLEKTEKECKEDITTKLSEIEKTVTGINTTIIISKAKIAAYGTVAAVLTSLLLWIGKELWTHFIMK